MIAVLAVAVALASLTLAGAAAVVASGGGRARGLAGGFEVLRTLSAAAARRRGIHCRPGLHIWRGTDPREVGIELGRDARPLGRRLYASVEDIVLVVAPPRTGKTGLLACHVQDAPGAVVATSTRPDLHRLTVAARERRGTVHVFNPEDVGGITSTVRWDPVVGCDAAAVAILRAGYLLAGGAREGVSDRGFWEGQAHRALRCLLMAAALSGDDMTAVVRWVGHLDDRRPLAVLQADPRTPPGWAAELESIQGTVDRTRSSIATTLTQAVQFMADPALAWAATPLAFEHFDVERFVGSTDALYILGQHRDHAPIAPLLAAFTAAIFEAGKAAAARRPGGRLDPPMALVLDEAARVARLPLDRWTADAGGSGIPIVISVQGPDQLTDVWGEHGGPIIWGNAAVKVIFGGIQSERHLAELSSLAGDRVHRIDGHTIRVPVMRPHDVQRLPDGHAVVLRRNSSAVIARASAVWRRRAHRQTGPTPEQTFPRTGPLAPVIRLADRRRRRASRTS